MPPSSGWIKCNIDGAFNDSSLKNGAGYLMRDFISKASFCVVMVFEVESVEEAEARAIWAVLKKAVEQNLPHIIIESDAQDIINRYSSRQFDGDSRTDVNFRNIKMFASGLKAYYSSSSSLSDTDNPPIKEIRYPLKSMIQQLKISGSCNGLVFSSHCQDYKYVRIVGRSNSSQGKSEVDVYSLKSDTWKRIQHIPYTISNGPSVSAPGVFCNGALHWIAKSYSGNSRKVLIALDLGNESVQEIPQPENLDVGNFGARYVSLLDKCLGMLCNSHMDGYEVWMMKDYGVRKSWKTLYKIPTLIDVKFVQSVQYLRKMEYLKNGEILLKIKQHEVSNLAGEEALVVYNPKDRATKILKHSKNGFSGVFEVETYIKNLVSLKSGTYVGDIAQEKKYKGKALAGIRI
ncbi:F-box protein CPR1-like [Papaver somniferum]|uniref:F-box protein CPR1-like n=1 Tax=Papaver somniferum TaxID=3469 RepID=UPI000E6FB016|nr:F-box protein CPR1-like [Papaver somniferum]